MVLLNKMPNQWSFYYLIFDPCPMSLDSDFDTVHAGAQQSKHGQMAIYIIGELLQVMNKLTLIFLLGCLKMLPSIALIVLVLLKGIKNS